MVIGRAGSNIQKITYELERTYKIDKPQIEVQEVARPDVDAKIVAKRIASAIEEGKSPREISNIYMKKILAAGAIGAEIVVAGKSGGGRSKSDRFIDGYLKKCGDTAVRYADRALVVANTKPGAVGIKVRIMRELPPEIKLKEIAKEDAGAAKAEAKAAEEAQKPQAESAPSDNAQAAGEAAKAEEKKESASKETKGAAEPAQKEQKEKPAKPKAERKPRAKKEKPAKEEKKEENKEKIDETAGEKKEEHVA